MANEKKAGIFNASARDGVQYRKASMLEMILGNANNGCGICFYLLMMYASYIANAGYAIVPAVAGIIITGTRLFDGFTDALFAVLFEKMNPKHGKIRIFLVVGWVMAALAVLMMYDWASGKYTGTTGIVVFILIYVVYICGYTINGMAGGTIGIVLTNDPTQRPMMGVFGTLYSYLVPLIFNNIVTFAILPRYDNQYNAPMLKEACYWYVITAGIFMLLACFAVRKSDNAKTFEVIGKDGQKNQTVKFKDMVAILKDNKPCQMYMLTGISDKLAQQVGSQSIITTMASGILIGSYAAATMIGNFTMIVGIVFAFGGGVFVAKMGAKKATTVWSWLSIAVAVITVVFCAILGPTGMKSIGVFGVPMIIYALLQLATTGTKMVLTTTGTAMRADIVDYEYARTGNYLPAVISGVYNFIDKLITSLASTIAAFCITLIGYKDTVPQMGDPATKGVFWMTMFLMFGLPILGWLCNIVAMKFYKLNKEEMVEVQKKVAEMKAKAETNENAEA